MEYPIDIFSGGGWHRVGTWIPDPEGIRRATRWEGERPLRPDWSRVADALAPWTGKDRIASHLRGLAPLVRALPERAARTALPDEVLHHCRPRWDLLAADLEALA